MYYFALAAGNVSLLYIFLQILNEAIIAYPSQSFNAKIAGDPCRKEVSK